MFNDKMAEVIHWGKGQDPATNEIKGQQLCHLQKAKRSEVHVILRERGRERERERETTKKRTVPN